VTLTHLIGRPLCSRTGSANNPVVICGAKWRRDAVDAAAPATACCPEPNPASASPF